MSKFKSCVSPFSLFVLLFYFALAATTATVHVAAMEEGGVALDLTPLVKRQDRTAVVSTEYGQITSARVSDRTNGSYHLQFITLEPNSLFLPVILQADMVFYVQTGTGRLSWTDEGEGQMRHSALRRGDVYRLRSGTVFFVQSSLESERQKLRIYAIFANSNNDLREPATQPYSSISDMVLGFDKNVLQAAFQVPEEVIEALTNGTRPPAIVHGEPRTGKTILEEVRFIKDFIGHRSYSIVDVNKKDINKKKGKSKLYNIFTEDRDFENCNGWSLTVTGNKLAGLKGSNIGIFMVNLTKGSMMGPHWNPMATEIAVVVEGQGMVRIVCPSIASVANAGECQNMRFEVEEGDVFAVPRFHPMAQMAFNNGTFVFMGFSTSVKKNYPQFLAGQASVLRTLDREIVATAFNVNNTTINQLLGAQIDSVILECTSCAEEEFRIMEEEIQREKEKAREKEEEEARKREEEKRREEEEARKREEEEARREEEQRREREEEEARKREEEEAKKREEEEERKREEEARREEEEARKREEEAQRRQEEEEARRREEEARRKQEEEEARRREQEEEEARRRQEEEEARRREQEEAQRRQEEEEASRQEQEEAQRRQEQEEAQRRQEEEEEEEARRQEQEEAQRRQEQEEAQRRQEEEEARRQEQEEAQRRQEEARRREEEEARQEERRRQEAAEREEEAARQEEWERGRGEQQGRREEEAEAAGQEGERGTEKLWGRRVLKRLTI